MKTVLYKSFLFVLLTIIVVPGILAADDIDVLFSSAERFDFLLVNQPDLGNLERIDLDDGSVLYLRTIQLGVPSGAGVELVSAQGSGLLAVAKSRAELNLADRPLVTITSPVTIRGRRIATLLIAPMSNDQLYQEVEIRIQFTGAVDRVAAVSVEDPIFNRIFKASLANYEQFRTWPIEAESLARPTVAAGPFDNDGPWLKVAVTSTGLHAITGAQLQQAGLSITDLPSDSLRMFSGGGLPLEMFNENPRPQFEEMSIRVDDGGDGVFGAGDRILFYGEAVDRWLYRAGFQPRFVTNVFTNENIYWLTTSPDFATAPRRMETRIVTPGGAVDSVIATVQHRSHAEQDAILLRESNGHIDDYYNWYWTSDTLIQFFVATPGVVSDDTAQLVLRGMTGGTSYMDVWVNGTRVFDKNCNSQNCSFSTVSLVNGLNEVVVRLNPSTYPDSPPYLDYLNVYYGRNLQPSNNILDFVVTGFTGEGLVEIVDGFTSEPLILDISAPLQPVQLTGYDRQSGILSFQTAMESSGLNAYYCNVEQNAVAPVRIEQVVPVDLRTGSAQADLIIVTTEQFSPALDEYRAYRQQDGISSSVVLVDDIMDNFSYGNPDPVAIRDFLKFAYENYPAPRPAAVLFVGDASYDYRNLFGTGVPNRVPSFIHQQTSYDASFSDDNYVYFGNYGLLDSDTTYNRVPDRGVDMISARWPVVNNSEIDVITQKIKRYESAEAAGLWRTRVTLVADDEYSDRYDNESIHTTQTEELEKEHIPAGYTRDKIYLWEYPKINREKPAVNEAIVEAFNQGSVLLNYVGHGNPDVWAHEHVLRRSSDLPQLNNTSTLPLVYAASCAIGFFDDPKREGMAEDFLVMSNGGAAGVISATRLVYSSDNAALNRKVYDILFGNPDLSACEALYAAKLQRQYINDDTMIPVKNDRAFTFFGDPFMRLSLPRLNIEITEYPDSLQALGRSRISGRVLRPDGTTLGEDGTLIVAVYDADREKNYQKFDIDYKVAGPTIFRGSATITNGEFDLDFITPLDIGFGGSGARISTYAMFDTTDAIGMVDSIAVSDSITVSADSTGPIIEYSIAGRSNFVSGDIISRNETLQIVLSDSSGINLAGGLGHGITLEIDELPDKSLMLTELFSYDQDDFSTGRLSMGLSDLDPGQHTFRVRAWDNANNSSSVTFSAEITASTQLAINDLLNYPNPMAELTTFYFELTQPVQLFSLEIFTTSGRKIRSYNRTGLIADNYPNDDMNLTWDGRDADGDRVATGVYIYKASAIPSHSGDPVESFGKIVVIN